MIKSLLGMMISETRKLTDEEVSEIRKNGVGNGFSVLTPADGHRQDNTLWFGECSVCGNRVTNSIKDGVWSHTNYTSRSYNKDGVLCASSSFESDYCPKERGIVVECEVVLF